MPYSPSDGDVTVMITNTLNEGVDNESFGIGDMHLFMEFDDGSYVPPATSPAFYDQNEEGDATRFWDNDCGATKKTCSGFPYWGGAGECGQGHTVSRIFDSNKMPSTTHTLILQGKVWSMDTWDGEKIHITMVDSQGDVLAEAEYVGNEREPPFSAKAPMELLTDTSKSTSRLLMRDPTVT